MVRTLLELLLIFVPVVANVHSFIDPALVHPFNPSWSGLAVICIVHIRAMPALLVSQDEWVSKLHFSPGCIVPLDLTNVDLFLAIPSATILVLVFSSREAAIPKALQQMVARGQSTSPGIIAGFVGSESPVLQRCVRQAASGVL